MSSGFQSDFFCDCYYPLGSISILMLTGFSGASCAYYEENGAMSKYEPGKPFFLVAHIQKNSTRFPMKILQIFIFTRWSPFRSWEA